MRIIQTASAAQMSQTAAVLILNEVLARQQRLVLGLATGQTPRGLYERLIQAKTELGFDPTALETFHLDEYQGFGPGDDGAMAHELRTHFLDPLGVPKSQRHFVPATRDDAETACADYEAEIAAAGGIDIQILGIGRNGHIAFNEPGTPFETLTHLSTLTASTRQANAPHFSGGKTPAHAMTMGPRSILNARQILLLASGESKAEAIYQMLCGPLHEDCPASLLRLHPHCTLVLDQAAASRLSFPLAQYTSLPLATFSPQDSLPPSCARVLVAAPHPDDASISCGGTLARLQKQGSALHLVSMTAGHRANIPGADSAAARTEVRRKEGALEAHRLGAEFTALNLPFYEKSYVPGAADIASFLDLLRTWQPTAVFSTAPADRHPAHRTSALVVQEAVRQYNQSPPAQAQAIEIWFYEGPWHVFDRNAFNAVVGLAPDDLALKSLGVLAHQSQVQRRRYDTAAESLARFRAITVPEDRLSGFGDGESPDVGDHVELFERVYFNSASNSEIKR